MVILLAYLPAYLSDLTIMNGHGAHRRQEGSQLAAEPACSRRVRAPSKPWGDGCPRQVGEATTRRVKWAWVAGLSGPVMACPRIGGAVRGEGLGLGSFLSLIGPMI